MSNYGLYCIVLYIFIIVTCTNRSNDIINMFTILIVPSPFGLISHSKMYVVKKHICWTKQQKSTLLHNIVNPSKHQDRPNVGAVPGQRWRHGPTLNQHRVDTLAANTGHQPSAGPMLAHRPLRWPNIGPNTGRTSRARWTVFAWTKYISNVRYKRVISVTIHSDRYENNIIEMKII